MVHAALQRLSPGSVVTVAPLGAGVAQVVVIPALAPAPALWSKVGGAADVLFVLDEDLFTALEVIGISGPCPPRSSEVGAGCPQNFTGFPPSRHGGGGDQHAALPKACLEV